MAINDLTPPLGAYSIKEAALYIKATLKRSPVFPRISTHHLHWWIREGLVNSERFEHDASGEFVNFLELVSFRMIATMRTFGIKSRDIQLASDLLKQRWGWSYPFAMEPVWVAKPDVFVHIGNVPVAVTRYWQGALDLMDDYLLPVQAGFHGLTFDPDEQAATWTPSEGVILDPKVQFGEPCIQGTRIPTETIWAFNKAGDGVDALTYMYGLPLYKIDAAIAWEEKIAVCVSESEHQVSAR